MIHIIFMATALILGLSEQIQNGSTGPINQSSNHKLHGPSLVI